MGKGTGWESCGVQKIVKIDPNIWRSDGTSQNISPFQNAFTGKLSIVNL